MKKLLLGLSLVAGWFVASSQRVAMQTDGSWKIKWNKKVILDTHTENEKTNVKTIKKADLTKKYFLKINFKEKIKERPYFIDSDKISKIEQKRIQKQLHEKHSIISAMIGLAAFVGAIAVPAEGIDLHR